MTLIKTCINVILRIILFLPLALLAYLFDGVSKLFGRISDGLFDMAYAMRQITALPYVKDIKEAIETSQQRDLQAMLHRLQ